MKPNKDIIEHVKELQKMYCDEIPVISEKLAGIIGITLSVKNFQYRNRVAQEFPKIAESLITAVEALEYLDGTVHHEDCDDMEDGICNCRLTKIQEALHTIRNGR